jgi:hypothetical protein
MFDSYLLEVGPCLSAPFAVLRDGSDGIEEVLELHVAALHGPVQGALLELRHVRGAQTERRRRQKIERR